MHHGRAGPLGDQENSRWAPQSVFSNGPSLQAKILVQHAPFFIKHQFIRTLLLENQMNWALHFDFSRAFFASSTPLPCNIDFATRKHNRYFYCHSIAFAVMHYAVQPKCIKEHQKILNETHDTDIPPLHWALIAEWRLPNPPVLRRCWLEISWTLFDFLGHHWGSDLQKDHIIFDQVGISIPNLGFLY